MEWMLMPFKRYAEFSGRSRRKEYWMFALFLFLMYVLLTVVIVALGFGALGALSGGAAGAGLGALTGGAMLIFGLFGLFLLAILIPSIAVGVRRLHDTDRSGWWLILPTALSMASLALTGTGIDLILSLASLVASVALLVFLLLDGTRGPNRFGPDPKDPAAGRNLEEVFR
jgi:uncharacterized membrane protein YhaH (DUF805 family)